MGGATRTLIGRGPYHEVGAATTTCLPSSAADPIERKSFKDTVLPFDFLPFLPGKKIARLKQKPDTFKAKAPVQQFSPVARET